MNHVIHDIPVGSSDEVKIVAVEAHFQFGDRLNTFCWNTWRKLKARLIKEKNLYVVFPGDWLNCDRPSMRVRKQIIYAEEERQDALSESDVENMDMLDKRVIPELEPIKHKILGVVDGDHFRLYHNRTTSTQYILKNLKIPHAYLGRRAGWIRLRMNYQNVSKMFSIFVRHGKDGSGDYGADVTALRKQNTPVWADMYIGGHTHKKWGIVTDVMVIGENGPYMKPVMTMRAGNLMKPFLVGETTYSEEAEYNPLPVGYPEGIIRVGRVGPNKQLQVKELKCLS